MQLDPPTGILLQLIEVVAEQYVSLPAVGEEQVHVRLVLRVRCHRNQHLVDGRDTRTAAAHQYGLKGMRDLILLGSTCVNYICT